MLELDWFNLFQDKPSKQDTSHFKVAICYVTAWVISGYKSFSNISWEHDSPYNWNDVFCSESANMKNQKPHNNQIKNDDLC
jgi:hypothetical protein